MTVPEDGYYGSIKLPSSDGESSVDSTNQPEKKVLALGAAGILVGIGGYIVVMSVSQTDDPWMGPIIALILCAATSLTLGIVTLVKSGRLTQKRILARVIGIVSVVIGGCILGISILLAIVLSLFDSTGAF